MNNIIYKDGKYKLLKTEDIYKLENLAKKSDIKRSRYCLHKSINSKKHQMLICLNKKSYIPIHSHTTKDEAIIVIKGKADLNVYDKNLKKIKEINLDKNNFYVEIKKKTIHDIKIHSENFIFFEITEGPFRKKNTIFY